MVLLMMMPYLSYVVRRLRYSGLTRLALEALAKAGCHVRPIIVYREGLSECNREESSDQVEGYETKFLDVDDMAPIAALSERPGRSITMEDLRRRIQAGNKCFAAVKNGDLAAFVWYDLTKCMYKGYPFDLEANEAYVFDAYTYLPFRGKGLAPHLRRRLYEELAEQGRDVCYSISERFNRSSLIFKKKLGARRLLSAVHVELFSRWGFTLFVRRHTDQGVLIG